MKNIFIFLAVVLITTGVLAQAPKKMSYQAVIRNSSNALITNSAVGVRISIIQGSINGTEVYKEIYNPNPETNDNGLLAIEIGTGVPATGIFSNIDWGDGPFYIKIETDPTGGTNYTITGMSQLLSVPYAMYAQTAESLVGGINEVDPFFGASPAYGITSANISHWNTAFGWGNHTGLYRPITYVPAWNDITGKPTFATIATSGSYFNLSDNPFLITSPANDQLLKFNGTNWVNFTHNFSLSNHTHTDATTTTSGFMSGADKTKLNGLQNADGSETKITAGAHISVAGTGTTANPYVINTTGIPTHFIGELYGGGILVSVWIESGIEHGLIASLTDLSTGIVWSNIDATLIGVTAQSPTDGQTNTAEIIGQAGHTSSAAKLCDDYNHGGFGDWYLPSMFELNQCSNAAFEVNRVLGNIDGFALGTYWSSTETGASSAACTNLHYGISGNYGKNGNYRVRAMRKF